MLSLDMIYEYVNTISNQIRWKKARTRVSEEMTAHIIDGRNSYMTQGLDESAATEKAITDTGDATIIGTQFDRIHRPKPQWGMFAATFALLILGFLIRLSVYNDAVNVGSLPRMLFLTGIGITGMFVAYFVDFTLVGKYPKLFYFGIISFSIVMILFSPSVREIILYVRYSVLLFPLAFSAILFMLKNRGYWGMFLCSLSFLLPGVISFYMRSMTGLVLFFSIGITLLSIAFYRNWFGIKRLYGLLFVLVPICFFMIAFLTSRITPYWMSRLAGAINPYSDPEGAGFMSIMTRELINGAVLFGQGNISNNITGLGEPNLLFNTDLILTALIYRFGWFAFAMVLLSLLFFVIKGFIHCIKQKSGLGFFISISIMLTICVQVVNYILFNIGIQFTVPISLPLISHGNLAMIINLVLIGFMLSVFRTGDVVSDENVLSNQKRRDLLSWDSGKLIIKFKHQ